MLNNFKNFLEKNLSETDFEKKVNSLKYKIKDAVSTTSPKLGRKRDYALHFSDPVIYPPALPQVTLNKDLFNQTTTEYSSTPFTFYYEEIEETFPVPNAIAQETDLPVIPEPPEGMHPYGFDQIEHTTRRNQSPVSDIKPRFLNGKNNPMRTFNQTPAQERILSYQDLNSSSVNLSLLTYICIADYPLNTKTKKQLWKRLSLCPLVETLILKNVGIGGIGKNARFPNLRFCDLSQNRIKSFRSIRKITKYSLNLEVLNLLGNPICRDDYQLRLSAKLLVLETISQKQLTVDERVKAIMMYGNFDQKSQIDTIRWQIHLDNLQEVRSLRNVHTGWQPQNIIHLVLQNSMLKFFYVGNLPNLQHLDLSSNMLSDISKSGMEKCTHLFYCSFRNNQLVRQDMINIFELTPSMRFVNLTDNRLDAYRQRLIYITRNLKGINRMIGLVQIDDTPITKEERIKAIEVHESNNPNSAAIFRWKILLIERFGHKQLQTIPDYLSLVKSVTFPRCNLTLTDVSLFLNAQILDFSGNHLTSFTGLQHLKSLRILHLHDNPDLDTNTILQQLANTDTLESFSFHVSNPNTHSRSTNSREYRSSVMKQLVPKNRNLLLVDNTTINFNERVDAYSNAGFAPEVVEKYRFFLALTVNCTMHFNRGIHPDQVEIGKQYDPIQITTLRRLRDWNLITDAVNFSFFVNVTELDLTNNKLTDISNIGLQNLKLLKRLSLINNHIRTPLPMVAQILDNLVNLEIFAIRANPNMQSPQDRLQLIGHMQSMRQIDAPLKVVDTEVTIYDKVEGWKLVGGPLKDAELFKLAYITGIKSINLYDHTLINLELCDCALEYLDVSPYVNLKTLLLPNNRFKSLDNLNGLTKLSELFALDLRHNELHSSEEIKTHISQMPNLQVLGLFGNPFTKSSNNYRVKFLALFPPLYQQHKYPLSILDVNEITTEEISEASLVNTKTDTSMEKKENLFNVSLLRRASHMEFGSITELDLRGCGLTTLVLQKLPNLVVLNLSDNLISDNNIKESSINNLQSLKALDLRNNKLKDIVILCKIIDLLNVETLFIEENSCYDKDTEKDRIRFFKKLTNSKIQTTLKYLNGVEVSSNDLSKFGKTKQKSKAKK